MTADDRTRPFDSGSDDSNRTQPSSIAGEPAPMPAAVGRYRIKKMIGEGGFGVVYLARDERLDRNVAIKVPHQSLLEKSGAADLYLAEARTVAKLEHPNIVPIYDFGTTDDFPCFIVMKYIDGESLARRLAKSRLGFVAVAKLTSTIARSLHHAHRNGVVHRDLKPGNILIDNYDNPCVVDFGLALREQDVGKGSRFVGTAIYMSPEQARGEGHRVDGRSDIYSLGTVMYQMLTGRRTVSALNDQEILEQVKFQDVKPLRQIVDTVPKELERICLRALSKRASERYTTALDMADELDQFCENEFLQQNPSVDVSVNSSLKTELNGLPAGIDTNLGEATSSVINVVPKGLRSFESHDADFFMSLLPGPRDREGVPECVRFWIHRLQETDSDQALPVGVLYGPSGCGKSSMVKAGLLPKLSSKVETVFVEATAIDTEGRLSKLIRNRWFSRDDRRSLPELVAEIRRGVGPESGQKVLIVLDQFEQWLHSHSNFQQSELVEALRQCDGGRVQCLLLVRDDFWLSLSRFMRALETPLVEGHNTAMVDLFDQSHAYRVMAAFGRAFGKLPASKNVSPEQDEFLKRSVEMLSEGSRVISVRLALYAEMMKDRPWTPRSLDSLGGTTGVGVEFLEQTFVSASAPPAYRYHQQAACKVLKAMLPKVGVDIRGEKQSAATLLEVSGYQDRPQDFDALLRILDTEVRLIAPTVAVTLSDSVSGDSSIEQLSDSESSSEQYFQLTHDYLVQSLREWLTRKQKLTRQGRAELRLAERTVMWSGKRESRMLPSCWEWLCIRLFTDARDHSADQQTMMQQMDRFLGICALVVAAVVPLVIGFGWEYRGRSQSRGLMRSLTHAPTSEVPAIVENMEHYRRWIDKDLQDWVPSMEQRGSDRYELHKRLALLPQDQSQVDWLVQRSLVSTPEEVKAIRRSLESYMAESGSRVTSQLWEVLGAKEDLSRELRAACLLAAFSPDDARWQGCVDRVLSQLTSENSLLVNKWAAMLQPIAEQTLPVLADIIAQSRFPGELQDLAELYSEISATTLIGFDPLLARLEEPQESSDDRQDEIARQRANVATSLAICSLWEPVWPLLRRSPDPTGRSFLISFLGVNDVVPPDVHERLAESADEGVREALILILGDLSDDRWALNERNRLAPVLKEIFGTEHSTSVQSAIHWTLNRWEPGGTLDAAEASKVDPSKQLPRMARISPGEVVVQERDGTQRILRLDHPLEIGCTEVTIAQFRCFKSDQAWDRRAAPTAQCPVHETSWFDAAAYCNWLSEQAGLAEDQFCYAPNGDGHYGPGTVVKSSSLELAGFRLPTVNEWEYACRGGTRTYWSMGNQVELLHRYAWSMANSGIHSHPVGVLRPNHFGLFDMQGNVWEWCHDRSDDKGILITSTEEHEVQDDQFFALCGGTYLTDPMFLGSASVNWNRADTRTNADGFRVVRTVAK